MFCADCWAPCVWTIFISETATTTKTTEKHTQSRFFRLLLSFLFVNNRLLRSVFLYAILALLRFLVVAFLSLPLCCSFDHVLLVRFLFSFFTFYYSFRLSIWKSTCIQFTTYYIRSTHNSNNREYITKNNNMKNNHLFSLFYVIYFYTVFFRFSNTFIGSHLIFLRNCTQKTRTYMYIK